MNTTAMDSGTAATHFMRIALPIIDGLFLPAAWWIPAHLRAI